MEIFKESLTQREKFKVTSNKLLNHCFILKQKEDTRNNYIFIVQHKELFIEYFDLLGYNIEINEMQGVISLTSLSGTGRLRLKKVESIILLILRLLYIEKCKELSLNEHVIILSDEIHEKYNMLKIESKPTLDKTPFTDTIRLFKRYNIISNIDRDVTMSNARIQIYPSILFAVPHHNLNTMYDTISEKLNLYINGGDQSDDEETLQDSID